MPSCLSRKAPYSGWTLRKTSSVSSASVGWACSTWYASAGGGWYYDDPAAPTRVVMCKSSCDSVSSSCLAKASTLGVCRKSSP